jgi:hypothetical protein
MADTTVTANIDSLLHSHGVQVGPVWVDVNTAYVFYVEDAGSKFVYQKTTDGGATWGSQVDVSTAVVVRKSSLWYDGWTPGNAGTKIHVTYMDATSDDVHYRALDTSDDSLGSEVVVFAGVGFTMPGWGNSVLDIVRSRGGNLYIGFWGDADGEFGFYRSTDNGATWTSRAQLADGNAADGILLMPGDETDTDDIWCIYWDRSANELSLKVYDDSGDSWSETSIATSMADDVSYYQMSAAPRHRDNHVILAAWSEINAATADLKVWDIGGSSSITAKTNVLTDTDETAQVAVLINQQNDDIYVVYLKGGTWRDTVDAKYKKSTDGGTTWGSEQSYSEDTADDLRAIYTGISVGPGGGRFQPSFFNIDLAVLYVNLTNSIGIFPVLPLRATYVGASVDEIPSHGSARS